MKTVCRFHRGFCSIASIILLVVSPGVLRAEHWESRAPGPGQRINNTAVFTGSEVIVWGGGRQSTWLNDGGIYNCATDTWRPVSRSDAPRGRWFHVAVWTGSEMIVWGGRASFSIVSHFNDGARYNPVTDNWRPMSTNGAPSPRSQMVAVWTGEEMLVWGGTGDSFSERSDGARYNPQTDTWRSMAQSPLAARFEPTAVWTGSEMILYGGLRVDGDWVSFADGARYNPTTDTWTPISSQNGPGSRTAHTAVWTGSQMLVWGGRALPSYTFLNSGAIYDLATDSWSPISLQGAPQARMYHAAVWTGREMVVWGGMVNPTPLEVATGGRYDPVSGIWTPTTLTGAPQARYWGRTDSTIWTGAAMFIYAGWDYPTELNTTALYYPDNLPLSPAEAISALMQALGECDITRSDCRPLEASLAAALQALDHKQVTQAVNHLEAFQHKVEVHLGKDQPALAQELIEAAQDIIDVLCSPGH
jgi:N-acetylneuraminic acid mutarotase